MSKQSLEMPDGSILEYEPMVTIRCIYCKKYVTMAKFNDGSVGVLHDSPECIEFTTMDPLDFVRKNREWIENDIAKSNVKIMN